MNFDLYLFRLINNFAKKSKALDFFAVFFARFVPYVIVLFLFLFALATANLKILFIPLLSALFARFLINEIVYFFYKRKRPPEVLEVQSLIEKPKYPSFPSNHTSFFFALSFTLFLFNWHLATFFLIISMGIVFFRIFCGVHWPSDVLAGILIGFLTFAAVFFSKMILI